jgi:hypothetical protein
MDIFDANKPMSQTRVKQREYLEIAKCCFHGMILKVPVLGRFLPRARDDLNRYMHVKTF